MSLILVDKHGFNAAFTGFAIARENGVDVTKGHIYPLGKQDDMQDILDNANELQSVGECTNLIWHEDIKVCELNKDFTRHGLYTGNLAEYATSRPGANINPGCVWIKSAVGKHDWFAVKHTDVKTFKTPVLRWTAPAYRYRMQAAQLAGKLTTAVISTVVAKVVPAFKPFNPEPACTQYVTVEFNKGGKEYTYLLPGDMKAAVGDDAVVVVNNKAYPELNGTKVVRITGVYDRNPSDYHDSSLKKIEHVVSKANERREELEALLAKKQNQYDENVRKGGVLLKELQSLKNALCSGNY